MTTYIEKETADWAAKLPSKKRYVGFADMLGYKSILDRTDWTDGRKAAALVTALEAVHVAIVAANADADILGLERIEWATFSGCVYASSMSGPVLLWAMARLFSASLGYWTNFGADVPWIPFLRGGVAKGWTISMINSGAHVTKTGKKTNSSPSAALQLFNNPIGLGVASAYLLGEGPQRLSGMRIRVAKDVVNDLTSPTDVSTAGQEALQFGHVTAPVRILPLEDASGDFELDWFHHAIMVGNVDCIAPLQNAPKQFTGDSIKHYLATLVLAKKSCTLSSETRLVSRLETMLADGIPELLRQL